MSWHWNVIKLRREYNQRNQKRRRFTASSLRTDLAIRQVYEEFLKLKRGGLRCSTIFLGEVLLIVAARWCKTLRATACNLKQLMVIVRRLIAVLLPRTSVLAFFFAIYILPLLSGLPQPLTVHIYHNRRLDEQNPFIYTDLIPTIEFSARCHDIISRQRRRHCMFLDLALHSALYVQSAWSKIADTASSTEAKDAAGVGLPYLEHFHRLPSCTAFQSRKKLQWMRCTHISSGHCPPAPAQTFLSQVWQIAEITALTSQNQSSKRSFMIFSVLGHGELLADFLERIANGLPHL